MSGERPTTVLIADDEIDMRLLVRVVLESAKRGIEVVGEAQARALGVARCVSKEDVTKLPDIVADLAAEA